MFKMHVTPIMEAISVKYQLWVDLNVNYVRNTAVTGYKLVTSPGISERQKCIFFSYIFSVSILSDVKQSAFNKNVKVNHRKLQATLQSCGRTQAESFCHAFHIRK